jgi:hypothetical protein
MYNTIPFLVLLFIVPLNVYGIDCWCQKGPATYQEFFDNGYTSSYTNCYLTGNNPSSNTCYDATCPGGNWVQGNAYFLGEILVSATDGDDCISQCSALGVDYNIANMYSTCGGDDDSLGSCNILTCPQVWDGHCGAFNTPTDKWCDYDGPGSNANVCCAADFSECCESDGGAIGGTIAAVVVFIVFCFWYCKRRRDNTNEEPPNCAYKFFCPPCAVFGYQGCENKSDACMTCCCCWLFTLCCWEPKKVIVNNEQSTDATIQSNDNIPYSQVIEIDGKEVSGHV